MYVYMYACTLTCIQAHTHARAHDCETQLACSHILLVPRLGSPAFATMQVQMVGTISILIWRRPPLPPQQLNSTSGSFA